MCKHLDTCMPDTCIVTIVTMVATGHDHCCNLLCCFEGQQKYGHHHLKKIGMFIQDHHCCRDHGSWQQHHQ